MKNPVLEFKKPLLHPQSPTVDMFYLKRYCVLNGLRIGKSW